MAVERIKAARWLKRLGLVVSLFFLLAPAGVANAGTTVVSLTFDDGYSNQYTVRPILASRGMHGTFYINSNKVETNDTFLSWSELTDLSADGNEIAGHTLDHVDLTTVDSTEARRQVCDDRWVLLSHGFPVTSFAYPYGARNASLFSLVESCGYNSARRAWGLCSPAVQFCPVAETVPPEESVFAIRTHDSVTSTTTLADMQRIVLEAENGGGGWVPLVFHHICNACNTWSTSAATLDAFLSWLAPRSASGTVVKTVNEVIGGTLQAPPPPPADSTPPTSSIACNSSACSSGWYAGAVSVSLSATDSGSGIAAIRYTTDGLDPTVSSPLYSGAFSVSATTTVKYRAWDNAGNVEPTKSHLVQIDGEPPASSVACNGAPCSSGSYAAPVTVTLSAVDSGSGLAAIRYTTDGSDPAVSSAVYSGPFTVSATATVKYRAWDAAGNVEPTNSQVIQIDATPADTTPPTSSIACNGGTCSSGWYSASVSVTLSAVDSGSGVTAIRYTIDGSEPSTSSPVYSAPFTVSATATVKYRAWDNAGNIEVTKSQLIQIDVTAPQVTLTNPANGQTVSGLVRLTATASDGDSGVARVDFYVDGKLEGTSTSAPYRVNWNTKKLAKGSHTIYVVAFDRAGNSRATSPITVVVA